MFIQNLTSAKNRKQTEVVKTLQIFDLLQLSRTEKESRDYCRRSLHEFGRWKKTMPDTIHPAIFPYDRIRGMILRRQARDAVSLYKAIRERRIRFFERYIEGLPPVNFNKRLAS